MSALPAETFPGRRPMRPGPSRIPGGPATARAPRPTPDPAPRRHLRPAPAPAQRRRPRLAHAVLTLAGIGVILLGQLALSIALADGTYRISTLQSEQVELARTENALAEKLELSGSTQSLIARAGELGMVASGAPVFLDLVTGTATGTPKAAGHGASGNNLIGNSLLDPEDLAAFGAAASSTDGPDTSAVGSATPATPVPADTTATGAGLLPSPITR